MRKTILTFAILFLTTTPVLAQKTQQCHNDGPLAGNCGQSIGPLSEVGPTTSPIQPRKSNDTRFIENQGNGLDTGCTFRPDGPLVISLPINRVVGATNSDGTLQTPMQMVGSGVLSLTATLRFPAFDVDLEGAPGVPPELDKILFNGHEIGSLSGSNETWKLNEFEIPIEWVRFGKRNVGGVPTPGNNEITILIDQGSGSDVNWCTAVDWVELSFKAMSPVILVHGNGQEGSFYEKTGFESYLTSRFILFDHSIDLPVTAIRSNGSTINRQLPGIVRSFGVDSIHLVAHSKGGLDIRAYLEQHQSSHDSEFKILSLTTLSSPHDGTLLTDLLEEREAAAKQINRLGSIEYENFPAYTQGLAFLGSFTFDDGLKELTTKKVALFNKDNVPALPADFDFNVIGGDADLNNNGQIDRVPDEFSELLQFNIYLKLSDLAFPDATRYSIDAIYKILRDTQSVRMECCRQTSTFGFKRLIAKIIATPSDIPLPNDTLVTGFSAMGTNSLFPRTAHNELFLGGTGRNHASIANAGVAAQVVVWLFVAEQSRGDLR